MTKRTFYNRVDLATQLMLVENALKNNLSVQAWIEFGKLKTLLHEISETK